MEKRPKRTSVGSRAARRNGDEATTEPKPQKRIPGIVGRSAWFAKRAGSHEQALSIERLRVATAAAESMLDRSALIGLTLRESQAIFSRLSKTERDRVLRTPTLIDVQGRMSQTKTRRDSKPAMTAFSPLLDIGDAGYLFLPLGARSAPHLDIEDLIVAEVSDDGTRRLNHTFSYWAEQDLLVGRLWRSGVYQVHGWPRDPLLRAGLETVARYWPILSRGDDGRDVIVEALVSLLGHGMNERQARILLGSRVKPPFVKHWWDTRVFELPKAWQSIGPFPTQQFGGIGRVTQIAVHPTDGKILIAGSAGGGVWRTNNGGAFWWPTMQLQPTLTIGAVAIATSNPQIMYAASGEDGGGWNPAWSGVGLYRSSNGGYSWTLMTSVASTRFSAIAIHPTRPETVYLAGNRGLHKTTDGGLTWRSNPGQQSLFDRQITDVVVAFDEPVFADTSVGAAKRQPLPVPLLEEQVYIGVSNDGVYRSTVGGEQSGAGPAFTRLDGLGQLPFGSDAGWIKLAVGVRGAHRSRFLAVKLGPDGSRIFTTIDGGTTWVERAKGVATVTFDEWCSLIAVDPVDENVLYAGAANALMRTSNGGSAFGDWVSISAGVHPDQQDMAFDPQDPRRIYLANDGGVYQSSNRGDSWTFASGYLAITQFYDIDISEKSRHVVAGGAQDNGVYYRDDFGFWRNISWGDGTQTAIDPTNAGIFYFSSQAGLPDNLRRSVNSGGSHVALGQIGLSGGVSPWVTIIKLEPRDTVTNPLADRVMFVCGVDELFRSADSGQTWQRVEDASGIPFRSSGEITSLEFATSDPSVLYLGTEFGALYRAANGGQQAEDWTRIDTPGSPADALFPFSRIQAIRVAAQNPNDVWLVFGGSGVSFTNRPNMILNPAGISHLFRNRNSVDVNGWRDVSGAFATLSLPDVPTNAAALDDWDAEVAYAGTDVGVFRTGDGGDTWSAYQTDLPRTPVVELRFNRRFRRLFAGTMGRGIYVRDV